MLFREKPFAGLNGVKAQQLVADYRHRINLYAPSSSARATTSCSDLLCHDSEGGTRCHLLRASTTAANDFRLG